MCRVLFSYIYNIVLYCSVASSKYLDFLFIFKLLKKLNSAVLGKIIGKFFFNCHSFSIIESYTFWVSLKIFVHRIVEQNL